MKKILFACLIVLFPTLLAFQLVYPAFRPVFNPTIATRPVLIVDAGHGGEDGGAISLSGVSESRLNLAIAKRIDQLLGVFGAPVVMVRQEDISLHDTQMKTLREKKNSDLHNRVDLVNRTSGVLLSIHQNSFPSGEYHGAQVFYAPTHNSKPLAEAMQQTLRTAVDPQNHRQATQIPKTVYLMNHVSCPAILIECGFLTNPTEETRLRSPNYQTKLAAAIAGCWLNETSFHNREEGIE